MEVGRAIDFYSHAAHVALHVLESFELPVVDASREINRPLPPMSDATAALGLAYIHRRNGEYDDAVEMLQLALSLFRDLGHSYGVAGALYHLGKVYRDSGQCDQARATWHEALEMYE